MGPQFIAGWNADYVLIEDVAIGHYGGEGNRQTSLAKELIVSLRIALASGRPFVQVRQFGRNDGRLDRIKAEITTHNLVMVLGFGPMSTEAPQLFSALSIVCYDHSPVSGGAEIL
jgi:hypothetical protein